MSEFTVSEVIDGDTFKVKNGWRWIQRSGDTVRPTGYNTPEEKKNQGMKKPKTLKPWLPEIEMIFIKRNDTLLK